jgi:signal transduction histidine kinase
MTRPPPASDIAAVHRAGRTAAAQAAVALTAVLLVVGAVVFAVDVHVQNQQIAAQLISVASTADDVTDPPPGVALALRDTTGKVSVGAHASTTTALLAGAPGFSDVRLGEQHYRALVADNSHGRVVALLDLKSFETGRSRLLLSLGIAELAGILASIAVVVLLTRRSIRPLSQALALQRQFVADASHELRAPLTVLNTRAQLIARRFDQGDAHQTREHIDALISDTRALGDVIDDLLASASMATDSPPVDRVEVSALAAAVRESMSAHAESAGVTLRVTHDSDSAATDYVVLGSASALRRAITSLVDNAWSHEHPGGTITIRVGRQSGTVVVDVADDGVGVDPAAVGTLFTRFSHGDLHTATAGRRRYGIGLALVREIARTHRGDIQVAQTPGGGATFTLTIPAAPVPHDSAGQPGL